MKINKPILSLATCLAAVSFMASCASTSEKEVTKDCSTVFETRYVGGKNIHSRSSKETKGANGISEKEKPATECKVLEVKFDKKNKCELVGSDKINDFAKVISENKNNKLILIAPEAQLRDLMKMAEKYMSQAQVMNLGQHFDSELFKNLDFPYKGMRCTIGDKEVVLWSGKKQVILTLE
jgi:hypothetical protein